MTNYNNKNKNKKNITRYNLKNVNVITRSNIKNIDIIKKYLRLNRYSENFKKLSLLANKKLAITNNLITSLKNKNKKSLNISNSKKNIIANPIVTNNIVKSIDNPIVNILAKAQKRSKPFDLFKKINKKKILAAKLEQEKLSLTSQKSKNNLKNNPIIKNIKNIRLSNSSLELNKGQQSFRTNHLIRTPIQKYVNSLFTFDNELAHNTFVVYKFNNNAPKFDLNSFINNASAYLKILISKPVYEITPFETVINSFFYKKIKLGFKFRKNSRFRNNFRFNRKNSRFNKKQIKFIPLTSYKFSLNHLSQFISKKINNPIVLNFTRLHKPNLESQILANTLGYIVKNSRMSFRRLTLKLFRNTRILKSSILNNKYNVNFCKPTSLLGIRIKLGGRLLGQKIRPRFSSKIIQRGNLGRIKAHFINTSRFIAKNKRGAFSFTVKMGHIAT